MRAIRLLVLSLALAAAPPALSAQEGAPAVEQPAAAGAEAPPAQSAAAAAAAPSSTLPARYTPPRTLRAYWHLFVAFAVAWVLLFGYTVALARRWGRLERELEGLAGR